MLTITKEQAQKRYNTLPQVLRDALFSYENASRVTFIGRENQLEDEQIEKLATISGDIIMGFLDINDAADRIKEELKVDEVKARAIFRSLNSAVFSSVKKEIEENYRPEVEESEEPLPASRQATAERVGKEPAPMPMKESAKSQMPGIPAPTALGAMPPHPVQKSFRDFIRRKPGDVKETPSDAKAMEDKPTPNKVSTAERVGKEPEGPKVNLQSFETPNESPATPFMLHQKDGIQKETTAPSTRPKIAPKLNIKAEEYKRPAEKKQAISAQIEMPGEEEEAPTPKKQNSMRVVHYNGFRTPLNRTELSAPENHIKKQNMPPELPKRQSENSEATVDLRKFARFNKNNDENTVDLRKKQ